MPESRRQALRDNAWTIKGVFSTATRPVDCAQAGRVALPVLLVGGEFSPHRYVELMQRLGPCLPRQRRAGIAGASHDMMRSHPQAFNALVVEFFAKGE